jgi:hypothetical protein
MLASQRVLTFDIGIRNLAWCLLEKGATANSWKILGWENYDLLAGGSAGSTKQAPVLCETCKKKATHEHGTPVRSFCKKHCLPNYPPLSDLSGNVLKKIPAVSILQKIAEPTSKKLKKADLVEHLKKKFSTPIEVPKATKAIQTDLGLLHGALQTFVTERAELFRTAQRILLENQPAFKNPTMKSIQILLFATIRERVLPGISTIGFVHAGKKTKGSTGGDKGYAERKKASETRVNEWLQKENVAEKTRWTDFLKGNQKKNDLCDTLCMCLDSFGAK